MFSVYNSKFDSASLFWTWTLFTFLLVYKMKPSKTFGLRWCSKSASLLLRTCKRYCWKGCSCRVRSESRAPNRTRKRSASLHPARPARKTTHTHTHTRLSDLFCSVFCVCVFFNHVTLPQTPSASQNRE